MLSIVVNKYSERARLGSRELACRNTSFAYSKFKLRQSNHQMYKFCCFLTIIKTITFSLFQERFRDKKIKNIRYFILLLS